MEDSIARLVANATNDLLGGQEARTVSRVRASSVLADLAQRIATESRETALLSLLNTEDMAARLDVSARRVRALAKARNIGWQVSRGTWVFTPDDVERLRPGPAGRRRQITGANS